MSREGGEKLVLFLKIDRPMVRRALTALEAAPAKGATPPRTPGTAPTSARAPTAKPKDRADLVEEAGDDADDRSDVAKESRS
jgi:hypothetical protein